MLLLILILIFATSFLLAFQPLFHASIRLCKIILNHRDKFTYITSIVRGVPCVPTKLSPHFEILLITYEILSCSPSVYLSSSFTTCMSQQQCLLKSSVSYLAPCIFSSCIGDGAFSVIVSKL